MMPILANLVWPALYLTSRMFAVWPIAVGLIVEFFFVRQATNLRGWRCLAADIAMNLASTALGILLIPLSGIAWELLASITIHPLFNVGTFNPVTWGATVLLAAGVNALVEGWVLKYGFKQRLGRRGFCLLFTANLVSVSIAFVSIVMALQIKAFLPINRGRLKPPQTDSLNLTPLSAAFSGSAPPQR